MAGVHPAMTSASVLTATGLRRSYGAREVLSGVDLTVGRGEFVCVIGHSGAGKTTLLRILAGLDDEFSGRVTIADRVGLMFQDARLLPWQRAATNVTLGLRRNDAVVAGERALTEVGLESRGRAWPRELSGGEVQRVALARALVREPELLLLDEPFGALDALTRAQMHLLLGTVARRRATAALLITHDLDEAIGLADRVLTLASGRVSDQVDVTFPHPRERDSAQFGELRRRLLASLRPAPVPGRTP
jgi:sulfonate transport system ATP-binding protein